MRASLRRLRGRALGRPQPGDDGMVLLVVVGVMAVLTLFLLTSLALTLQTAPISRRDQDAKSAVAAAEAGVEDYVARLTADSNYYTVASDATNPALATAGLGAQVPGTSGGKSWFRYQLVAIPGSPLSVKDQIASTGTIRLQVTGTSRPGTGGAAVSRTLTATLKPKGFLKYVYFSDVEVLDPELFYSFTYVTYNGQTNWNGNNRYRFADQGPGVRQACGEHYEDGRSAPSYTATAATPVTVWDTVANVSAGTVYTSGGTASGFSCLEIQWATGDVINGGLHSNDALQVGGSVLFTDPVTESSWTNPPDPARRWWNTGVPSLGTAGQPGYWPVYAAPLALPVSNAGLLQYVNPRVDVVGAPPGPGCYYTGQTRIIFQGTSMRVLSPGSSGAAAACLDAANRGTEQVITPIPPVIYVDTGTSSCTTGALGYPMANEWLGGITTDYSCSHGTVYVQGTVDGQVTVASKDDIVVTGDLQTQDNTTGSDIIGLVARNYVWVYHPVNAGGTNLLSTAATPHVIQASILALGHSFLVQNWAYGALLSTSTATKLNVTGSISQKYRGPVGTSGPTGYIKNYVYDGRLRSIQPPYFLQPTSSPWLVSTLTDK